MHIVIGILQHNFYLRVCIHNTFELNRHFEVVSQYQGCLEDSIFEIGLIIDLSLSDCCLLDLSIGKTCG
jgi:hypothetical protein